MSEQMKAYLWNCEKLCIYRDTEGGGNQEEGAILKEKEKTSILLRHICISRHETKFHNSRILVIAITKIYLLTCHRSSMIN